MFAKLSGIVDFVDTNTLIIDVNGVGYLVSASGKTLQNLPAKGQPTSLYIETHVREDQIQLFGFLNKSEQDWFRLLHSVQGVGGRVALALLSAMGPQQLTQAIAAGDKTALCQADGVGPKLAARLLTELKDKVGQIAPIGGMAASSSTPSSTKAAANTNPEASAASAEETLFQDAVSALTNLGYGRMEAYTAVANANQSLGDAATLDGLIKQGLKELSA